MKYLPLLHGSVQALWRGNMVFPSAELSPVFLVLLCDDAPVLPFELIEGVSPNETVILRRTEPFSSSSGFAQSL